MSGDDAPWQKTWPDFALPSIACAMKSIYQKRGKLQKITGLSSSSLLKSEFKWGVIHFWTNPNCSSCSHSLPKRREPAHEYPKKRCVLTQLGASIGGIAMMTQWENGETINQHGDILEIKQPSPTHQIVRSPSSNHIKHAQVSKGCTRTGYRLSKVRPFPS